MFDRFTDGARKSLGLARQASLRFDHDYIGTEHMLLGLLAVKARLVASVLARLGVGATEIREEVERRMSRGPTLVTLDRLPFTPRGKRALEFALEEATALGHTYIGPEHLLLGVMRDEEGIAGEAFAAIGLHVGPVRDAIVDLVTFEPKSPDADGGTGVSAPEQPPPQVLFEDPVHIALARGGEHAHDRGSGMTPDDLWVGVLLAALQRGPEADLGIARADLEILLGQAVFVATRRLTCHWPAEDAEHLDPDLTAVLKRAIAFARDRGANEASPRDVLAALVADDASGTCGTLRSVSIDPATFRRPGRD